MKPRLFIVCILFAVTANAQTISTIAGTGVVGYNGDGIAATAAELFYPQGLNFDSNDNLFFTDQDNSRLRKIDMTTGIITTVAGTGTAGYNGDGILATAAQLNYPVQVTFDELGNTYIVDWLNNRIRKITFGTGIITTVAGTGVAGYNGDGILATAAQINQPAEVVFDHAGNMYIGDWTGNRVRKVDAITGIISTIAGTGVAGYNGDGIAATAAQLNHPGGIAFDPSGNIYICDWSNYRVREINALTGIITTFSGTGVYGYNGDGILASSAQLSTPTYLRFDILGNLYIVEAGSRVRKVDVISGLISTIAGTGVSGYNGDGIPATTAQLNTPFCVAFDAGGNVYIGDHNNSRIRKIAGLGALPISLISFSGSNNGMNNILKWTTASELNNDHFTIEKSIDAINFEEIGIVKGAGNSISKNDYSFIDDTQDQKINYYLLKQTDYNGKFTYSQIIAITNQNLSVNIYPNPAKDNFLLTINSEFEDAVLEIFNLLGEKVFEDHIFNSLQKEISLKNISSGIYTVKITTGEKQSIKKLVVR